VHIGSMLVVAGVESLSSFMSVFVLNLLQNPRALIRTRDDPSLIAFALEESLRFNTSAQRFKRVLTRDVELHGSHMREGDQVALLYGSANRDPRKFDNPDIYDIDRNPRGHLGFGSGPHYCLGTSLARTVAAISIGKILSKFPNLSLVKYPQNWVSSSNFRSPQELIVSSS
jgi:cytochrome P450